MPVMRSPAKGTSPAELRALVEGHEPATAREATAKERFLAELSLLDDPCDEHAGLTHVTASGIVTGRRGTVLHLHKRLGVWMQSGGHIDAGETPDEAARREATEELGLVVEHPGQGPCLIHLDVHQAAQGHTHLDLRYLLVAGDGDPDPPPGESPEARWYAWEEAVAVADDGLAEALAMARVALGKPASGGTEEAE